MKENQGNRKTNKLTSVTDLLNRFMMLMGMVIATLAFTACPLLDDDENSNENGNGGSTSGKRVKTMEQVKGSYYYRNVTSYLKNHGYK